MMESNTMNEQLILIAKNELGTETDNYSELKLKEDLGLNSLKMILFLNKCCKALSLTMMDVDPKKIETMERFGELAEYLDECSVAKQG